MVGILDQLSHYRDYVECIKEICANSHDADSTDVYVSICETSIEITDNGTGMSPEEVNDKYLLVGGSPKKGVEKTPVFDRLMIGNKGIGKFAGLGIAKSMKIETWKAGQKTTVIIDQNRMKQYENPVLDEIPLPANVEKDEQHNPGTKITLNELTLSHEQVGITELVRELATRLPICFQQDRPFRIFINNKLCEEENIKTDLRIPISHTLQDNAGQTIGRIEGFIALAKAPRTKPGIIIRVKGVQVGEPSLFGITTRGHGLMAHLQLLCGKINADFLIPNTKRDGFSDLENQGRFSRFNEYMTDKIKELLRRKEREDEKKTQKRNLALWRKRLKNIAKIFAKFQHLPLQQTRSGMNVEPSLDGGIEGYQSTDKILEETEDKSKEGQPEKERQENRFRKSSLPRIKLGSKYYRTDFNALGTDEKEVRINHTRLIIVINTDHPSYPILMDAKGRAGDYLMYRAIANEFLCSQATTPQHFYEELDKIYRFFVEEQRR